MEDRPGKKMFIGLKPTSVPNQELVTVFQVLMDNDDGTREGFPVFQISNLLEDPLRVEWEREFESVKEKSINVSSLQRLIS